MRPNNLSNTDYEHIKMRGIISKYLKNNRVPLVLKRKHPAFVTGGKDNIINIYSNSLEIMGSLHGHKDSIWCLEPISQRQSEIADMVSGSFDKRIKLWEWKGNIPYIKHTLLQHKDGVSALSYVHPNLLVSGSDDKTIIIWDLGALSLTSPTIITWHKSPISGILNINNNIIVSGDYSGELRIWNIYHHNCLRILQGESYLSQIKNWNGNIACNMLKALTLWDVSNWHNKKDFHFRKFGCAIELLSENTFARGTVQGNLEIIPLWDEIGNHENEEILQTVHSDEINDILKLVNNIIITISDDSTTKVIDSIFKISYFCGRNHIGWVQAVASLI